MAQLALEHDCRISGIWPTSRGGLQGDFKACCLCGFDGPWHLSEEEAEADRAEHLRTVRTRRRRHTPAYPTPPLSELKEAVARYDRDREQELIREELIKIALLLQRIPLEVVPRWNEPVLHNLIVLAKDITKAAVAAGMAPEIDRLLGIRSTVTDG